LVKLKVSNGIFLENITRFL